MILKTVTRKRSLLVRGPEPSLGEGEQLIKIILNVLFCNIIKNARYHIIAKQPEIKLRASVIFSFQPSSGRGLPAYPLGCA